VPDRTRPLIRLYNKTVNKDSPGLAVGSPEIDRTHAIASYAHWLIGRDAL